MTTSPLPATADVAVVGAGAAGLATAIFAARRMPQRTIIALDGAAKLGAKILVSGGARCNVTNVDVTTADFFGGSPNIVRRILRGFDHHQAVAFFREIGVSLHVEEFGKLFPDTNDAHTVLSALLDEARRRGVTLLPGHRVTDIERIDDADDSRDHAPAGFRVLTSRGEVRAARVVLATGGLSLPKTGSDGGGYALARKLGHSIVPTTPALAPLVLDGEFHVPLSGVSHVVELTVQADGMKPAACRGPMLWTHFGLSGPAAMDVSRHWHRAKLESPAPDSVRLTANFLPGENFAAVEEALLAHAASAPKSSTQAALARKLPARVAGAVLTQLGIDAATPLAHLSRDHRRRLLHALLAWPMPVRDSRGYAHAEVTAGGVPLAEVDPSTLASRKCPGLFLVGEILDVDGRIGGFNFQWAWSSGFAAGEGLARSWDENEE